MGLPAVANGLIIWRVVLDVPMAGDIHASHRPMASVGGIEMILTMDRWSEISTFNEAVTVLRAVRRLARSQGRRMSLHVSLESRRRDPYSGVFYAGGADNARH